MTPLEAKMRNHVGIAHDGEWPSHAWPGGYTLGYITTDGELLCGECMNDPTNPIHFDESNNDGWGIVSVDICYDGEGGGDWCAHCNRQLAEPAEKLYKVIRFCQDENDPAHRTVLRQGLTLAEAQEHCRRDDTHGDGWFDGYDKE